MPSAIQAEILSTQIVSQKIDDFENTSVILNKNSGNSHGSLVNRHFWLVLFGSFVLFAFARRETKTAAEI
jgi:hypothetical protein